MSDTETYTVEVICDNCGQTSKIETPKGEFVSNQRCPNCGCQTVRLTPRKWYQ